MDFQSEDHLKLRSQSHPPGSHYQGLPQQGAGAARWKPRKARATVRRLAVASSSRVRGWQGTASDAEQVAQLGKPDAGARGGSHVRREQQRAATSSICASPAKNKQARACPGNELANRSLMAGKDLKQVFQTVAHFEILRGCIWPRCNCKERSKNAA